MRNALALFGCLTVLGCSSRSIASFYSVGGTIAGLDTLAAQGLALTLNQGETLLPVEDSHFHFTTVLPDHSPYGVVATTLPPMGLCSLQQATGTIESGDVTDVAVLCVQGYTLGGSATGLEGPLTLANNGNVVASIAQDGPFTLTSAIPAGQAYDITVATLPPGQACRVGQGMGVMGSGNLNDLTVACLTPVIGGYSVGGALTGLIGDTLVLQNGNDTVTLSANGNFVLSSHITSAVDYNVMVIEQPTGQQCGVTSGSGTVTNGNVVSVAVFCQGNPYELGGRVVGLQAGQSLQVAIRNGSSRQVSSDGNFVLTSAYAYGSPYEVVVVSQPARQVCAVASGRGVMPDHDQLGVVITCGPGVQLGGSVSNLVPGTVLGLQNIYDTVYIDQTGPYTFDASVAQNSDYNVFIIQQPQGQVCVLSQASGATGNANITQVDATCSLLLQMAPGENSNLVIGQLNFDSSNVNRGNGSPSANSLDMPYGRSFVSPTGVFYQTDSLNNRVLVYTQVPQVNGANAAYALGQTSLVNDATGNAAGQMLAPASVSGGNGTLVVSDTGNHRVLLYSGFPQGFVSASTVVGQAAFGQSSTGCSSGALQAPQDAIIVGDTLFVADTANHRVLGFSPVPTAVNAAATLVLGQPNFTTCTSAPQASATNLGAPTNLWSDGNILVVVDANYNRVMLYDGVGALTNQQHASAVVGQAAFTSQAATTGASGLNRPQAAISDGVSLFISDRGNHRVLIYRPLPTGNGAAAIGQLGQSGSDFTSVSCNQGSANPTAATLCAPSGLGISGVSLQVTDTGNNRVLFFPSSVPSN